MPVPMGYRVRWNDWTCLTMFVRRTLPNMVLGRDFMELVVDGWMCDCVVRSGKGG